LCLYTQIDKLHQMRAVGRLHAGSSRRQLRSMAQERDLPHRVLSDLNILGWRGQRIPLSPPEIFRISNLQKNKQLADSPKSLFSPTIAVSHSFTLLSRFHPAKVPKVPLYFYEESSGIPESRTLRDVKAEIPLDAGSQPQPVRPQVSLQGRWIAQPS